MGGCRSPGSRQRKAVCSVNQLALTVGFCLTYTCASDGFVNEAQHLDGTDTPISGPSFFLCVRLLVRGPFESYLGGMGVMANDCTKLSKAAQGRHYSTPVSIGTPISCWKHCARSQDSNSARGQYDFRPIRTGEGICPSRAHLSTVLGRTCISVARLFRVSICIIRSFRSVTSTSAE